MLRLITELGSVEPCSDIFHTYDVHLIHDTCLNFFKVFLKKDYESRTNKVVKFGQAFESKRFALDLLLN